MPCDYHLLPHPGIQTLSPYIPGKSADQLADEQGISDIIKLASNENPLGCSHLVTEALASMSGHDIATYPISASHPLREKIAQKLSVDPDMILLGNGSDMIFPLIISCFSLHTNRHVMVHDCAFISYRIHAQTLGVPVVSTPLENWHVNIDAMIKACNEHTALIFLPNPNNPTGLPVSRTEIVRLLNAIPESTILVLDEAYFEYHMKNDESSSSIELLKRYSNLIITRTFSKAYGLAGLRIGYAIAHPDIITLLLRVNPPFTVNQAALTAAMAALDDHRFIDESVSMNMEGLTQLQKGFKELGIEWLPSAGNFITINCQKDAGPIYQNMQRYGIIVRPLHPYGMNNYLRVTVGTAQQNCRFLDTLNICMNP